MKITLYSILAAAACGMAFGQTAYTIPVGYETSTLKAGKFNVLGLTLHNSVIVAGILDSASGAISPATGGTVIDTQSNFTNLLTSGQSYILELTDGTIQQVSSWSGSTLNTPQNISGLVTGGTTTFKLRKAATVSDIFGATNSAGLQATPDGNFANADLIYIPNAVGGFDIVFYDNDTPGWVDTLFNNRANTPIIYADSIVIQRRGTSDLSLVVRGEIKVNPTKTLTSEQFTYVGGVYPAGSTLGNSGLAASVAHTPDGDFSKADLIFLPDGNGGSKIAFFDDDSGFWTNTLFQNLTNEPLTTGFTIQRRSATPYTITITPPSSYGGF